MKLPGPPPVLLCFFLMLLWPLPALAAERYDLGKTVETALHNNFTISAAASDHKASVEGLRSSRSAFGPVLSTGYDYQRYQRDRTMSGQDQDKDLFTWRISLTQNVFAGFATLAANQRAALQEENTRAGMDKARIDLVNLVQEHFYTYLRAREDVISAKDSLERLQSQLTSSQAFYEVGVSPRIDVLQAEVDVSTAESALLVAENAVATQKARLNTLLVLPMDADVEYEGMLDFIPFSLSLDLCLELAYSRRPDLIMAEKSVAMASKDVTIARSAFYPRIDAWAAWSTLGDDAWAAGSRTYHNRYNEWGFGATMEWPLFEWGRTFFDVRQAGHIQARIRAEADNLRQEIAFSVKERLLAMAEAAKRIKVAQKAVEQSAEAYRMADARYKSQVGTMTDVLDNQAKLSLSEASLAGARADYCIALSRLYAAIGEINPSLAPR